ncbi:hypothetical protein [Microbacterium algeriense]|uniref:hypothetical protein n=1 Tax=Microbacterium algeriense TaxID=2615184 RepID=UPI0022E72A0B|nr:hypothetical protein [Microbacterium algeriense]
MGRPKAPCGTDAAYRRHLREGVEVDEACRRAHTEAGRKPSKRSKPRAPRSPAFVPTADAPPSDNAEQPDDMKLIVDTLRTAFTTIAASDPTRLAPISREFRAAVEATRGPADAPKELSLADQLAQARAARAARTAGSGATG